MNWALATVLAWMLALSPSMVFQGLVRIPGPGGEQTGSAPAGIAILSGANGHGNCSATATSCTTSAVTSTGATLAIVIISCDKNACTSGVSDSKSNTWHALTTYGQAANSRGHVTIYYAYALTVGSGHTFTCSAATGDPISCTFSLYSGTLTGSTVYDTSNGGYYTNTETSQACGSITPSATGELIIAGVGGTRSGATAFSVSSGLSILDTVTGTSSIVPISDAYLVDSSASAINPTWTVTAGASDYLAATCAAFKHP